jgi:protein Mpv17
MAWNAYRRLLHTHPLKTKALTSSFITGLSDVGLQLYEQNSKNALRERQHEEHAPDNVSDTRLFSGASIFGELSDFKLSRTLTLAAVGLLYSGPVNHLWFSALEKLVRIPQQGTSVVLKLLVDQVMFAPVAIAGYMTVRGIFEGKSKVEIRNQLQEKVAVATKAAWQFWPVVNLISLSLVPVMYRVLMGNVCGIFWNAKLSFISSQTSETTVYTSEQVATAIEQQTPPLQCQIRNCLVKLSFGPAFGGFVSAVIDKMTDVLTGCRELCTMDMALLRSCVVAVVFKNLLEQSLVTVQC